MVMHIDKLKREHENLRAVLAIAMVELDGLERDPAADETQFRNALEYLRHYFDEVHHPHEDLIFELVEENRVTRKRR